MVIFSLPSPSFSGTEAEPSARPYLYNATTLASGDEFPMNSYLTSENASSRTFVYKGKEKGRGSALSRPSRRGPMDHPFG
jgi:hypothetical protein